MKEKYIYRLERKETHGPNAEWFSVQAYSNRRPYLQKGHVKQLMHTNGGRDAKYDPVYKVYVSTDGRYIFRILRAEIGEWENVE